MWFVSLFAAQQQHPAQLFALESYTFFCYVQLWSVQKPWASTVNEPKAIIPHSDNVSVCFANALIELSEQPNKQQQNQHLVDTLEDKAEGQCLSGL